TMFGILIGVCSVIAMLAIGEGASQAAQDQIARLGSRNIIINTIKPPQEQSRSSGGDSLAEYGLTYSDAERIKFTLPDAKVIVPLRHINQEIWYLNRRVAIEVVGTVPWYPEIKQLELVAGRFLDTTDLHHYQGVCVLDAAVSDLLFLIDQPIGSYVKIVEDYYLVVGIVTSPYVDTDAGETGSGGGGMVGSVYLPLTTVKQRFGEITLLLGQSSRQMEKVELQQITVKVQSDEQVLPTRDILDAMLASSHKEKDYQIIVPLELQRQAAESKRIFSIVLGSIAAISLLVGGIGIMNIMLATVSERTREIGIRRAVGAKRRDIIIQFLSETILLTLIGGLLGIALGALIPYFVTRFSDMPTIVTAQSVVLAFGISALIGITFGWYPAYHAAHMDPIESLRHE
ncbi:MAG: ABC transporter permease, partial [Planctomycetes bacterium]|nr:ABC transporter permease [Planctomycetota bacterium]